MGNGCLPLPCAVVMVNGYSRGDGRTGEMPSNSNGFYKELLNHHIILNAQLKGNFCENKYV